MNRLKALVLMQIRDKLDFSWLSTTKSRIQKIVLSLLQFIIITGLSIALIYLCQFIGLFYYSELIDILIVFYSVMIVLTIISCTIGLTKNLYLSDDNKVLATFPVTSSLLFFSKLIVYYFYELKKSFNLLIPITLGFVIMGCMSGQLSIGVLFWMWIPLIFIIGIPVLIGSFLSIPFIYVKRFLDKFSIIELILIIISLGLIIWGVVHLINLIPEDIDLINQWPSIRKAIKNFLVNFKKNIGILCYIVYVFTGSYRSNSLNYRFNWYTLASFVSLIAFIGVLIGIAYFVIKPIFFKMLSKSFEFDKYVFDIEQKNIVRKPFITFANKEFRINFRSIEFSGNYFIVYIIIPILILLLNNLFAAMNTKLSGEIMTYAFNILLILLPLLASNSMIATLYSKEGRAGYIKKTKPINPLGALVAKLLFNLVFSVISIIVSVAIFASFTKIGIVESIFLALAILLIQYGHIFYSATLDIMNPQNEQYATIGDEISNPNENKSTLVAFIMSFAIAFISYVFLNESYSSSGSFIFGSVKIFILSLFIFGSLLLMFLLKIKAYYYER